jgi:hypothetical protein
VGIAGGVWVGLVVERLQADWIITTARNAQIIFRAVVFMVSSSGDKN